MESQFEIVNWERYFALYENGKLLCLTVYKKGAMEVKTRIEELKAQLAETQKEKPQNQDQKEAKHVE
jgi:predicted nuclease with TOPRIM domain